jgi:hypothetical protein
MTKAIFRIALLCTGGVLLTATASRGENPPLVLESSQMSLEIDPTFGTIRCIVDKSSGIRLAPPPLLAENFRLVLLLPDKKPATVLGSGQKLSDARRAADGLTLKWNGPLKDTVGREHAVAVRMEIKLAGEELQFRLHLDNGTACTVREVCYPMIGGLARFGAAGKAPDGLLWAPTSGTSVKKIELPFGSATFAYPGQANLSFTCVESAAAGKSLYFASHDEIARYKVYRFEEHAEGGAKDVFASIQHLPFVPPGKAFDGSTVVLRVVDGDWRAAGRVYRAWFEKTFGICKPADCWIRQQSFFVDTMFQLPEGTVNYRFKDIPQWAKEAKDHGINAVLVSGWHRGGHDNGYPCYVIDPRLGTWQDLEDGIAACHKMGMKVYFFVNYQQVMLDSEWYQRELVKYREHGPNGETTWNTGWGMGTVWARMGHPKLMTAADPAFPQYRKILVDQFAKLAQIGADGVHVDKMFPSALDYNPNLPMSPDVAPWEGAILLTKEVIAACRKHNPGWAMSFECNWDRMLQFSDASWWVGNQRITRAVFPEHAETLSITTAYDYLGVNDAVREGHTVMLGPLNYSRSLGWKPWEGLADYIREVKRIRDGLAETVYLGEGLGRREVQIAGGAAPGIDYQVFRNLRTGKRVCLLTNRSLQPATETIAAFDAGSTDARVHVPFQPPSIIRLPAEIDVPAERIVFVEELPPSGQAAAIVLEDDRYLVEVSRSQGAVARIRDKQGGIELVREPRLADNFCFTLPIPGKEPWQTIEANYVYGKRQKLSAVEAGDKKVILHWDKPLLNCLGEKVDVSATMSIELVEKGILLGLKIDNPASCPIGEVFFPAIGGIQGLGRAPADRKATEFIRPSADSAVSADIFRVFANMSSLGDTSAEQFYAFPKGEPESWMEFFLRKQNRSVYLAARGPVDRPRALRLELEPGSSETVREDGNWPRPEELRGLPAGVSVALVDFANAPARKTYQAVPALISFHDGDWREAKRIYRDGR